MKSFTVSTFIDSTWLDLGLSPGLSQQSHQRNVAAIVPRLYDFWFFRLFFCFQRLQVPASNPPIRNPIAHCSSFHLAFSENFNPAPSCQFKGPLKSSNNFMHDLFRSLVGSRKSVYSAVEWVKEWWAIILRPLTLHFCIIRWFF